MEGTKTKSVMLQIQDQSYRIPSVQLKNRQKMTER